MRSKQPNVGDYPGSYAVPLGTEGAEVSPRSLFVRSVKLKPSVSSGTGAQCSDPNMGSSGDFLNNTQSGSAEPSLQTTLANDSLSNVHSQAKQPPKAILVTPPVAKAKPKTSKKRNLNKQPSDPVETSARLRYARLSQGTIFPTIAPDD